ncbi:MaoC family dehydratase [Microbacterium soli]|uniref:MaoC family dehydratase n=1 Tax=Microbacterium soli TaxID=446075 RepID=A0ABP7MT24_9MICO
MSITGSDNCFEDFEVGMRFRHARGKTITELENVLLTNLVMNTADAHFNEARMSQTPLGTSIVFGGITASLVIGLASQDTADSMLEDRGITDLRLLVPVVHGDTIRAATEVLATEPYDDRSGLLTLHHWGYNQRNQIVAELTRVIRVPRRHAIKEGRS